MIQFINNFSTTLAADITDTATTMTIGRALPALSSGDIFLLTLFNKVGATESDWEIVKVTSTGGVGGAILTIERAQDGTTAQFWAGGTKVELRLTAAPLTEITTQLIGVEQALITINGV